MSKPTVHYDEPGDTVYINFGPNRPATGIEIHPHILLRVDVERRKLVGITLLDYSILAQQTEIGPRSFPMTGLADLPRELRQLTLDILTQPPANAIFNLSAYTPASTNEAIPITSIQALPIAV